MNDINRGTAMNGPIHQDRRHETEKREAILRLRRLELAVMASLPAHLQLEMTDTVNALIGALRADVGERVDQCERRASEATLRNALARWRDGEQTSRDWLFGAQTTLLLLGRDDLMRPDDYLPLLPKQQAVMDRLA